nr:COL5 [Tamarix hispida]
MTIREENVKSLLSSWGLPTKPCDSCKAAAALLYCRAHNAFLCISCDTTIHVGNKLASRHERVWMCEVCEQAPASVTCKADAANLCVTCDRDIHSANPLARRHDRTPIVPFFDSTAEAEAIAKSTSSAAAAAASCEDVDVDTWLIPNPNGRLSTEFLFSNADPFLEAGYGTVNLEAKVEEPKHKFSTNNSSDGVVPNQPKSSSCKFSCYDIDFTRSKLSPFNYSTQCVSSSDVGVVPDGGNSMSETSEFTKSMTTSSYSSTAIDGSAAVAAVQLSKTDREARVLRYREKRKNRKFEKTIRYASRKAYAETRPRIKGRFAKRNEREAMVNGSTGEFDQIIFSPNSRSDDAFMFDHGGFGVVPSF